MGKATKWLSHLLSGKKKEKKEDRFLLESRSGPMTMGGPPMQEKKRWSFRRSVTGTTPVMEQKAVRARGFLKPERLEQKRRQNAEVAVTTVPVEEAAMIRLTDRAAEAVEEEAAVKIQSVFRSYLARKALCALKGIVKFQALIRGHLVRRQATATLRSMQAIVIEQARARMQRLRMLEEAHAMPIHRQNIHRRSPQEARSRQSFEMEENIKIVEMDLGKQKGSSKSRNNNYSYIQPGRRDHNLTTYSETSTPYRRDPYNRDSSPARSTSTLRSPRACSGHFAESINLSESIPFQISKSPAAVSRYMANTESSKAKARSHSAPRQRSDSSERPPMKQRPSVDGSKSVARGGGDPWSTKLDRSSVSLQESECGSTSSVLMSAKYARSLMAYEICSELSLETNT